MDNLPVEYNQHRGKAPDNKEETMNRINVKETPGEDTANISKMTRAIVEALGVALALDGKELVSVRVVCKDEETVYEGEFYLTEEADK